MSVGREKKKVSRLHMVMRAKNKEKSDYIKGAGPAQHSFLCRWMLSRQYVVLLTNFCFVVYGHDLNREKKNGEIRTALSVGVSFASG